MKKFYSLFLILAIICTMFVPCFATEKEFSDVPANAWFYSDVKNAVAKGLINGKSETKFDPHANLTYAEATKLATCLHKFYTQGNSNFEAGSPWYKPYVDYALTHNIIYDSYRWEDFITRREFIALFSRALSSEQLVPINNIPDNAIPDLPASYEENLPVYTMYRAGIIQGSDDAYNFNPEDKIARSEVAAILTRITDASSRKKFTITLPDYRMLYNTGYAPYDAKIHEYYLAMSADEVGFDSSDYHSINSLMIHYARIYSGKLYFTLYDINADRVPELIFSNGTHFIDIYTISNSKLVKIFKNCFFGERSRLHILSDGTLLTEGSSGASTSSCQIFKLNSDGSLSKTGAYYFDTNGPDPYMGGYLYISTNEYVGIVSNYISYSIYDWLNWNLFADMEEIRQKALYDTAYIAMKNGNYLSAAKQFEEIKDYKNANEMILECYYQYGKNQMELNYTTDGIKYLSMCKGYKDAEEIIHEYYYGYASKAFDKLLTSFSGHNDTIDNYTKAINYLNQCEGYKDSNNMKLIADKLYTLWYELPHMTRFSASVSGMKVSVDGEDVKVTDEKFLSTTGKLILLFNINDSGFSAEFKNIFASSPRDYNIALCIYSFISLFTDIEQTEDFASRYTDKDEWDIDDDYESFYIKYGGYKISVESEYDKYDGVTCTISVKK